MLALVYHGPGRLSLEERPRPTVQAPTDALVRLTQTTICGTDLAILKGGVSTVSAGRIIGHEGVGVVEAVGPGVGNFRPGDRVLISCITACGHCHNCRRGLPSNCANGGWVLGHTSDGCQAEYVRVPFADNGLHRIPPAISDETALMLADIIPTGLEMGVMNGNVKFGDVVAIIGAGPVGLAALLAVQFYAPAQVIVIDIDENRLALARQLGATVTIDNSDGQALDRVMAMTAGRGVDSAIEAVGNPQTCKLVQGIIGVGGTIANIGVYSQSTELFKQRLWTRNITIRMGLVNTTTIPLLLQTVESGRLDPTPLITHRLPFSDILRAYDVFSNAARERAVKIVLSMSDASGPAGGAASDDALLAFIVGQVLERIQEGER